MLERFWDLFTNTTLIFIQFLYSPVGEKFDDGITDSTTASSRCLLMTSGIKKYGCKYVWNGLHTKLMVLNLDEAKDSMEIECW